MTAQTVAMLHAPCAGARGAAAPPRTLLQGPLRHSQPRAPLRRAPPPLRVANEVYEARVDPAQLVVLASAAGLGAYWW